MSAQQQKLRERGGGHFLLWHLSSGAIAPCTEALFPREWLDIVCWLEVDSKSFGFLCFCSAFFCFIKLPFILTHMFSSNLFSPCPVLKRRRVTQQLGGKLVSSRDQPNTWSKNVLRMFMSFYPFFSSSEKSHLIKVASRLEKGNKYLNPQLTGSKEYYDRQYFSEGHGGIYEHRKEQKKDLHRNFVLPGIVAKPCSLQDHLHFF